MQNWKFELKSLQEKKKCLEASKTPNLNCNRMFSVSETCSSKCILGFLHGDHGSTTSKKDWLAAWDEATVESFKTVRAHDVTSFVERCYSNAFGFSLGQVFKDLKRPN